MKQRRFSEINNDTYKKVSMMMMMMMITEYYHHLSSYIKIYTQSSYMHIHVVDKRSIEILHVLVRFVIHR